MKPVYIALLVMLILFVLFLIFFLAFRKRLIRINYDRTINLKTEINSEEFINIIGGKQNIKNLYATSNHIHFTLFSIDQVQINMLKRFKIKEYNIKNNNLILNMGIKSKFIVKEIKKSLDF